MQCDYDLFIKKKKNTKHQTNYIVATQIGRKKNKDYKDLYQIKTVVALELKHLPIFPDVLKLPNSQCALFQ